MNNKAIKIDKEFQSQIPAPTTEERRLLEESIKLEGCRDPLVIWEGMDILLDGHHRYQICKKHHIDFKTVTIKLADRDAAADWIDANQLGRRNLKPDQHSLLLGRLYNRSKTRQGGTGANQHKAQKDQIDPSARNAAKSLAEKHGVGEATVKRAGKFADAVQQVKAVDPEIEEKINAGKAPPKRAMEKAAELVERDPQQAKALLDGSVTVAQLEREAENPKDNATKAGKVVDPAALDKTPTAPTSLPNANPCELAVIRATQATEDVLALGDELATVRSDILRPLNARCRSLGALWSRLFRKTPAAVAAAAGSGEKEAVGR